MFRFRVHAAAVAVVFAAGCSGGTADGDRVPVYETTGTIKLSGKPVEGAVVTFSPKGPYPAAVARTDSAGEYSLTTYDSGDGAAAGGYAVLVSKEPPQPAAAASAHDAHGGSTAVRNPAAAHAEAAKNAPKSEIPARYGLADQPGMSATVTADGENRFDFDLKP